MNALVKKEVRLLRPSWLVAMLLALVQSITRPYDFYVASLLFFGLTLMALAAIGRETSLNTFSSLVALPTERLRIWTTKLSVLAAGFLMVFLVWLAAFGIACVRSGLDAADRESSYNLFIAICLIAAATFTGGLWTTLLLRQLASAFWLTLVVPAMLSAFSGIFWAGTESDSLVIAVLSVVIGVYSLAGFLYARWLFFHAQDVGWSGGVITLPEWRSLFARAARVEPMRQRRPVFALLSKELQLQQGVLTGAVGLLALHAGIIAVRVLHQFPKDSAGEGVGEILTSIVWVLWLVLPAIIGSIAIAEERKVGVMESQLCQPASRRLQFALKAFVTLGLGIFLGGVMPMLLETIGLALGSRNEMFMTDHHPLTAAGIRQFFCGTMAFSGWVALLGLFASSLSKSFLQAVSIALVTFVALMFCVPAFMSERMSFISDIAPHSILPVIVAVPTVVVTLVWLAWLNFKNFREGWPLWRRNLLGAVGAFVCIGAGSAVIYHRAWEVFAPAEPAHGPAKFSLANPPVIYKYNISPGFWNGDDGLYVQLPDGHVWFDRIGDQRSLNSWSGLIHRSLNPFPASAGPRQYASGSNWVSFAVRYYIYGVQGQITNAVVYLDSVGIKADGTLWVSANTDAQDWARDRLVQFGDETNWQALSWSPHSLMVWLLKKDGTLWGWGTNNWGDLASRQHLTSLRDQKPYRLGSDSDWQKLAHDSQHLQKADGSRWCLGLNPKSGKVNVIRDTTWEQVDLEKIPPQNWLPVTASVHKDGTLWSSMTLGSKSSKTTFTQQTVQRGKDTNWVAVADVWLGVIVALKSDGSLWESGLNGERGLNGEQPSLSDPPIRLGIHHDWVALAPVHNGVVTLAADGSLWLWPYRGMFGSQPLVMKLPKQPQYLGNVLHEAKNT